MSGAENYTELRQVYKTAKAEYGVYWLKGAEIFEIWSYTAGKLMGVYSANRIRESGRSWSDILQRLTTAWETGSLYKTYGAGWEKPEWKNRVRKPKPASRPDPAPQPSAPLPLQPPPASKAALAGQPVRANRRQIDISFN